MRGGEPPRRRQFRLRAKPNLERSILIVPSRRASRRRRMGQMFSFEPADSGESGGDPRLSTADGRAARAVKPVPRARATRPDRERDHAPRARSGRARDVRDAVLRNRNVSIQFSLAPKNLQFVISFAESRGKMSVRKKLNCNAASIDLRSAAETRPVIMIGVVATALNAAAYSRKHRLAPPRAVAHLAVRIGFEELTSARRCRRICSSRSIRASPSQRI